MVGTHGTNERVQSKYDNPELIRRVVELRSDNLTWEVIADKVRDEYPKINNKKVSELYKKGIARSVTVEKRAGKKFDDFSKELNKMYRDAVGLMQDYLEALREINTELETMKNNKELDTLTARKHIIKTIPEATRLWKELREYMKFHLDQQEKIIETSKEEIWDYQTFADKTKEVLGTLETEGYVIIPPEIS